MANVVVEHVMLIPIMIVLILVFSPVANSVMSNYINQQRVIVAQDAVNQLSSTIQQLHYSLSRYEILPCTVVKTNPLPETIMSYPYIVTGDLEIPLEPEAGRKLRLALSLQGISVTVNKTIVLTSGSLWSSSELSSLSSQAAIFIQKFPNGTLLLGFK